MLAYAGRTGRKGEDTTPHPTHRQLETLGLILLLAGVVLGIGATWGTSLPPAWFILLVVIALALVATGLFLNRKYRDKGRS